ncbi:MAG TPA: class I SAM-dependent methyltransferase [Saprospiraceae bacterium]|nr:class I SAM-dependent methyltransferase [Saprospiraceae bacterium]
MKDFWDQRYSQKEYAYGETPNEYFRNQIIALTPGKILMPADGEGRNGVFAATLGWDVEAFDISTEGKRKAELLATKHKVNIHYVIGACGKMTYPENSFDAIALVYMHLPPSIMAECHRQLVAYLKPGGVIIFEGYSKKHIEYQRINPSAGGPRDIEMLFDIAQVQREFPSITFTTLSEEEIDLQEGQFHEGKAMVIRFTGKKK